MRVVDPLPQTVREIENTFIELADGTRLAARIWLPADAGPVPAILEYLPYRKRDGTCARDAITHPYLAAHGFACVRVDMRGNGDSDGLMDDEYTQTELDDGAAVIAWIAAQAWCSGRVALMGISWGGFNGLQIAALRPPALGAVVTLCSTDDRYADDIHYKGGLLLGENLGWGATMLSYSSRPPDPALVGDRWQDLWRARLEQLPLLAARWLEHQHRDAYWRHGSVCEDFSAIEVPVLSVGGWGDAYRNTPARLLDGLGDRARAIIGPWMHKYPHFALPQPQMGFLQEVIRWCAAHLAGDPPPPLPAMRAYVMDAVRPATAYEARPGRWVAHAQWPPAVSWRRLHMSRDQRLVSGTPDAFHATVDSPADCGLDAGEYCAIWLGADMPADQRRDDALSTCFESAPLEAPLHLLGATDVELEVAASTPVAQLAVRLVDVWPDGASTRITYGVLNLCHRDSHETPSALVPDQRYRVRVRLDDVGYSVPAGHRLRLSLSSAYWPLVWPSPARATLSISAGFIDLPTVDRDALPEPGFEPAEGARAWATHERRAPANSRVISRDQASGEVTLEIIDDFGEREDAQHGLVSGSVARETWRIDPDDPLSACAQTHWTQTLARGDWSVRTETRTRMTADATHFRVEAELEAYAQDELFMRRAWDERVARDLV